MKDEYLKLLKSGMFWEFHPELTGEWEKDKDAWQLLKAKQNGVNVSNRLEIQVVAEKINYGGNIVNRDYIKLETSDANPMYVTIKVGEANAQLPCVPTEDLIYCLEGLVANLKNSMIHPENDEYDDEDDEDDEY